MGSEDSMPNTLEELRTLEQQVEREWWWLNGALHAVAQAHADGEGAGVHALRQMQAQKHNVDRKRVAVAARIAELDRRPRGFTELMGPRSPQS